MVAMLRDAPHPLTSCYYSLMLIQAGTGDPQVTRVGVRLHPRAHLASTFQHPTIAPGISLGMYRHWFGVLYGISAKELVLYST
jgi:hypothetical protein